MNNEELLKKVVECALRVDAFNYQGIAARFYLGLLKLQLEKGE